MPVVNRFETEPVPIVSYTAFTRWEACPFQEALLRLGVPRAPKRRRDFLVGNIVHDTLEYVGKYFELPNNAWMAATFSARAAKVDWNSTTDRQELWTKAYAIAGSFAEWLLRFLRASRGILAGVDVEPYYRAQFSINPRKKDLGVFLMEARPDVVVRLRDPKRLIVIDYKSGSKADPVQLAWYHEVTRAAEQYADYAKVQQRYGFVRVRARGTVFEEVDLGEGSTALIRRTAMMRARALAEALVARKFEPNPDPYRCRRCRVHLSCDASAHLPPSRGAGSVLPSRSGGVS